MMSDNWYRVGATAFTTVCLALSLMCVSIMVDMWEHTQAHATVCGSQAK